MWLGHYWQQIVVHAKWIWKKEMWLFVQSVSVCFSPWVELILNEEDMWRMGLGCCRHFNKHVNIKLVFQSFLLGVVMMHFACFLVIFLQHLVLFRFSTSSCLTTTVSGYASNEFVFNSKSLKCPSNCAKLNRVPPSGIHPLYKLLSSSF